MISSVLFSRILARFYREYHHKCVQAILVFPEFPSSTSRDKEETAKSLFSGVGRVEQVTQSLYDRMIELKGQAKREEHHEEPRDTGGAQFAEATFSVYLSRKSKGGILFFC